MFRLVSVLIGYVLGCVQFAYILGKLNKHIDIRNYGSGNAGTTNAIRVMGWKVGLITFLGDFFKAVLAIVITGFFYQDLPLACFYAGLGVILGHDWPVYLKFRGGKGIASTLGVMYALDFRIGLGVSAILILTLLLTRYVSLGSVLLVISIPIQLLIYGYLGKEQGYEYIVIGSLLMVFALVKHRSNIKRLLSGTESKLGHKKDALKA